MNRTANLLALVGCALILVVSGCSIINNFRDHYVDTTTEQLTTDMNRYMRVLVPEWNNVEMFGERSDVGAFIKDPCGAIGTGLKPRSGPPWIFTMADSIDATSDSDGSASINSRVAILEIQYGFREQPRTSAPNTATSTMPEPEPTHQRKRYLENEAGYLVLVYPKAPPNPTVSRLNWDRTLVEVTSPCVRYPGDE